MCIYCVYFHIHLLNMYGFVSCFFHRIKFFLSLFFYTKMCWITVLNNHCIVLIDFLKFRLIIWENFPLYPYLDPESILFKKKMFVLSFCNLFYTNWTPTTLSPYANIAGSATDENNTMLHSSPLVVKYSHFLCQMNYIADTCTITCLYYTFKSSILWRCQL